MTSWFFLLFWTFPYAEVLPYSVKERLTLYHHFIHIILPNASSTLQYIAQYK